MQARIDKICVKELIGALRQFPEYYIVQDLQGIKLSGTEVVLITKEETSDGAHS